MRAGAARIFFLEWIPHYKQKSTNYFFRSWCSFFAYFALKVPALKAQTVPKLFVFSVFSDNLVDVFDKSIYIDAVSASALTDGFEMSSHAADAAQTVFSKNLHDFGMVLNGFNNAGIFSNHYAFLL